MQLLPPTIFDSGLGSTLFTKRCEKSKQALIPLIKSQNLNQWSGLARHTATGTSKDDSRALSLDIGGLGQLVALGSPWDVLASQSAVQAACPDSHNHARSNGDGKSNRLSGRDAGLLCLGLDLIGITPVGSGKVNNISVGKLTGVKNNVSVFIKLLRLQVVNEVAGLLFVAFLVGGL